MKISVNKIYPKSLILALMIVGIAAEISLSGTISVISKYDEIVAIIVYLYLIYLFITSRMSKYTKKAIVIMALMTVVGLFGNFYWGIQTNTDAIFMDLGIMYKVFATFFASYEFFRHNKINYRVDNYLNCICKVFVLVGFLLALVNIVVDIGMHTEYIYGMRAFHFVMGRVGNLNAACVACIIVFLGHLNHLQEDELKKQKWYIFMAIMLLMSTLRTRAFAFAVVYAFCYFVMIKRKSIKLKLRYVMPIGAIIAYVAYPKLQYYFVESTDTARSVLMRYGFATAKECFPIGAGFGSYGTHAAREYWTSLYDKYDFEQYYGLSQDYGVFLVDNYWPAIAGEFGFIGVILVIIMLSVVFKTIADNTKNYNILKAACVFGLVCLLIASTVSSSFFNFANMLNAALIGFEISNLSQNQIVEFRNKPSNVK